jgi:hypothetical protein
MHNAPLPPTGSFQERLLFETILREKNEKFAVVSLFARLLGVGMTIGDSAVDDLLDEYKEELYQLRYNYKYETSKKRRIILQVQKASEQARQMRRIEQMTVTDEELREMAEKRKNA